MPRRADLIVEVLGREPFTQTVLMGDMNTGPTGGALDRFLAAGFVDAGADDPTPTHPTVPVDRIDFILVSPDVAPLSDYTVLDVDTSDHLPVAVTVTSE